ncbi:FAD/NAD(P)-binding protein [Actinomadura gamaensis]|uniref:FAD/NAD(P)-binding protein n=1 Tax=Actinomadura gamaensis TaxID=1763541 RepID=A0ABV9TSY5_9ACTN
MARPLSPGGPPEAAASPSTPTPSDAPTPSSAMTPLPYRVVHRRRELADTVTLVLEPVDAAIADVEPGQFTMLYAFGVGEVPISVSRTGRVLHQTIRAVGAVSGALCACRPGEVVGVRGPFGVGWEVGEASGRDLLFAAGGIGLAPLRPAILAALAAQEASAASAASEASEASAASREGSVTLLVGARTPHDLLYTDELDELRARGVRVEVTVDRADPGWTGHTGLITTLVGLAGIVPGRTSAFLCGPEVMMRFTADALLRAGLKARDIRVSLERNMRCGVGWCGHCQLGPRLVCRDGPVVGYAEAAPLLATREL